MRNLNNFPDELFELSGKRLMAIALGFIVFGGTAGILLTQKLLQREITAGQTAIAQTDSSPLVTKPVASVKTVANEWHYFGAYGGQNSNSENCELIGITTDSYKKVWQHYADKIDYASMVKGTRIAPKIEQGAIVSTSTGGIMRGVNNHHDPQTLDYAAFTWANQNHRVKITLHPAKTGTFVSTSVVLQRK